MKKPVVILLLMGCALYAQAWGTLSSQCAVTYNLRPGGRFGDDLVCFCKAKFVAHVYKLPFLYKPFPYSDQLCLHDIEMSFDKKREVRKFRVHQVVHDIADVVPNPHVSTLYIVKFNTRVVPKGQSIFDSNDQIFRNSIKQLVQPRTPLATLPLPAGKLTVALHVRRGGGFDRPLLQLTHNPTGLAYADKKTPLRFAPTHFYIDQLKKIAALHPEQELYVHIFTDDQEPHKIADEFRQTLSNPKITFGYRAAGNKHDRNVLEDFFSMTKFDCLIRPQSYYSLWAEFLGEHKVVAYPMSFHWEKHRLIIDEAGFKVR